MWIKDNGKIGLSIKNELRVYEENISRKVCAIILINFDYFNYLSVEKHYSIIIFPLQRAAARKHFLDESINFFFHCTLQGNSVKKGFSLAKWNWALRAFVSFLMDMNLINFITHHHKHRALEKSKNQTK